MIHNEIGIFIDFFLSGGSVQCIVTQAARITGFMDFVMSCPNVASLSGMRSSWFGMQQADLINGSFIAEEQEERGAEE